MQDEQSSPPNAGQPRSASPRTSRTLARSMIALTAVMFVAMVAVLFYRWISLAEPEYVLIVSGTPAWKGATVTVDNVTLQKPYVRTIGGEHGMRLAFYLDRGTYSVLIERDGKVYIDEEVFIDAGKVWQVDLGKVEKLIKPPATTQAGGDANSAAQSD